MGFPHSLGGKESTCNAGDPGSIPGSGRSPGEGRGHSFQYSCTFTVAQLVNVGDLGSIPGLERYPGEEKGYPFQYSGLENSMGYIVHGLAKSQTWLSNFHCKPGIYSINLYNKITIKKYIYYVDFSRHYIKQKKSYIYLELRTRIGILSQTC